jgi:hypothetical protein
MSDRIEIVASGFGGQGVVRLGQILGEAAVKQGLHVTMLKSHGTEMRGGYVRSQVVLSKDLIDSPMCETPDYFIALSWLRTTVSRTRFRITDSLSMTRLLSSRSTTLCYASRNRCRLNNSRWTTSANLFSATPSLSEPWRNCWKKIWTKNWCSKASWALFPNRERRTERPLNSDFNMSLPTRP